MLPKAKRGETAFPRALFVKRGGCPPEISLNPEGMITMAINNAYLNGIYEGLAAKSAHEPEFLQAVYEVLESLVPVIERRPDLVKAGVMERIVEPERTIMFRVSWVDDSGKVQVNRGYRVQYNSAIGP